MKNLFLSCLTLLIASISFGQTPAENLNTLLQNAYTDSSIPGIAVAIVSKDQVLYKNAFGYEDLKTKQAYTQESSHNIGSTSKTFIGIAIMQLVESGKLNLDEDINNYLPFKINNPYQPESIITLRQLATHTATIRDRNRNYALRSYVSEDNVRGNRKGLPFIYKIQFKRMLKNKNMDLGAFLEKTLSKDGSWYHKKNFYKNEPGTTYNYSNIGSALAAYIVEIISGEKYADYVVNNILKPLQLNHTNWTLDAASQAHFTKRYIGDKSVPDYNLITYPDGGMYSNTTDLSTYLMAMMKGYYGESNLLRPESFDLMMGNQFKQAPLSNTAGNIKDQRGLFWDIFGTAANGDIGHSGSDPGVLSFMYFNPEDGLGCILLTNMDSHKNFDEVLNIWQLIINHKINFKES